MPLNCTYSINHVPYNASYDVDSVLVLWYLTVTRPGYFGILLAILFWHPNYWSEPNNCDTSIKIVEDREKNSWKMSMKVLAVLRQWKKKSRGWGGAPMTFPNLVSVRNEAACFLNTHDLILLFWRTSLIFRLQQPCWFHQRNVSWESRSLEGACSCAPWCPYSPQSKWLLPEKWKKQCYENFLLEKIFKILRWDVGPNRLGSGIFSANFVNQWPQERESFDHHVFLWYFWTFFIGTPCILNEAFHIRWITLWTLLDRPFNLWKNIFKKLKQIWNKQI